MAKTLRVTHPILRLPLPWPGAVLPHAVRTTPPATLSIKPRESLSVCLHAQPSCRRCPLHKIRRQLLPRASRFLRSRSAAQVPTKPASGHTAIRADRAIYLDHGPGIRRFVVDQHTRRDGENFRAARQALHFFEFDTCPYFTGNLFLDNLQDTI